MKKEYIDYITELMNRLPFVRWDRYVHHADLDTIILFGWISRDDGKFDFDHFTYLTNNGNLGFTTSSKKYSAEISYLLYNKSKEEHDENMCKRIEIDFVDVKNSIRL